MKQTYILRSTKDTSGDFSKQQASGVRSYATQLNLEQAIIRWGLQDLRHIICQTVEGKFTAVFLEGGIQPGSKGFFTVGF